jgi:hypothetical protein
MLAVNGEGFRHSPLKLFHNIRIFFLLQLFISYDVIFSLKTSIESVNRPINFFMVSERKVLNSNLDSVIYHPFQLNILRVRHHLLKRSLSPHVRESVKILIK